MVKYEKDDIIREKYTVRGRFYVLTNGKMKIPCRSVVTITSKTISTIKNLMVVMLNPGSSCPLDNTYKETELTDITKLGNILYDIRESQSKIFFEKLKNGTIPNLASIFFDARRTELENYFTPNIPVILAWGIAGLSSKKKEAYEKIKKLTTDISSVQKGNKPYIVYHPLPLTEEERKKWLKNICQKLLKK